LESLVAAIFIGGDDNGDNVLSEFFFLWVGMPLISCIFCILYFYNNLKNLFLLQALVPVGLISKYYHLFHDFYSPSKGGD
jgi:hypothetical protein